MARRTTIIAQRVAKAGPTMAIFSPWPAPTGDSGIDGHDEADDQRFASTGDLLVKPSTAHRLFAFLAATARKPFPTTSRQ